MEAVIGAGIRFSFDALSILTDGFSDDNILVKSQHFNLFRGKFAAQSDEVTVKIWHSSDKLARFREEITILGHPRVINCPNIVKLMGYCCEDEHVGAIYKLQSVDTLENLFDKDQFQWRDRMIVAVGIAHIFRIFGVQCISHSIYATLPSYIILDQESNPVLCDVRVLTGGIMLFHEEGEDSFVGNDARCFGEDGAAGNMKPNGIFALGMLLLRLIREERHVIEDVKTKLPYVGYEIKCTFTSLSPSNSQLKSQSFFYQCDCYSVTGLADECLVYDEKCLTITEVIQKLENLVLFSLPVRTSSGKVAVGARTLVYFTYNDLCELTDNFSVENLFAITQFGEAYRGRIQQGWKEMGAQDIVVKIWGQVNFSRWGRVCKKSSLEDNICRLRDEVFLLTQSWMIDNPNVVKLLGYCFEDKKVGAVYLVQPLYTLESVFDDEWFEWKERIVAALELARTLALLHGKGRQYVVSNMSGAHILIDQDKKPIFYDFSMLHGHVLSGQRAARNLHLTGSIDYVDPYLIQTGLVVPQSDIFAFGILLMSLICKRDMSITIRSFVYQHIEAAFKSKTSFVHESFASHPFFDRYDERKLSALAMKCVELDYLLSRPTAREIVQQLQGLSLFSDAPFSNDVKAKVIDSCGNIRKTPPWWKNLKLLKKLSITHDKHKGRKWRKFFQPLSGKPRQSGQMSSHALAKQEEIIMGPRIFRPLLFETTPEEIRSRIQLIDASLKPKMEEEERQKEVRKIMVKRRQSNFNSQLVGVSNLGLTCM